MNMKLSVPFLVLGLALVNCGNGDNGKKDASTGGAGGSVGGTGGGGTGGGGTGGGTGGGGSGGSGGRDAAAGGTGGGGTGGGGTGGGGAGGRDGGGGTGGTGDAAAGDRSTAEGGGAEAGGAAFPPAMCPANMQIRMVSAADFCAYYMTTCTFGAGAAGMERYASTADCTAKYEALTPPRRWCVAYHLCVAGSSAANVASHCQHPPQVSLTPPAGPCVDAPM